MCKSSQVNYNSKREVHNLVRYAPNANLTDRKVQDVKEKVHKLISSMVHDAVVIYSSTNYSRNVINLNIGSEDGSVQVGLILRHMKFCFWLRSFLCLFVFLCL